MQKKAREVLACSNSHPLSLVCPDNSSSWFSWEASPGRFLEPSRLGGWPLCPVHTLQLCLLTCLPPSGGRHLHSHPVLFLPSTGPDWLHTCILAEWIHLQKSACDVRRYVYHSDRCSCRVRQVGWGETNAMLFTFRRCKGLSFAYASLYAVRHRCSLIPAVSPRWVASVSQHLTDSHLFHLPSPGNWGEDNSVVCSHQICSHPVFWVKTELQAYRQKGGMFPPLILTPCGFSFPWMVVIGGMGCQAGGGVILEWKEP